GRERAEQFDVVGAGTLLAALEEATGEQRKDQHAHGVEVNLAAALDRGEDAPRAAREEREGDGHINVRRAGADGGP
ncbi:MAG: hypothetical protein ACK55I_10360, partial [bacterium]